MTHAGFVALFPIKAEVTQEIINQSDPFDTKTCVGALTLKRAVPDIIKTNYWGWGDLEGTVIIDGKSVIIGTEEGQYMMEIRKPTSVTFIVKRQL